MLAIREIRLKWIKFVGPLTSVIAGFNCNLLDKRKLLFNGYGCGSHTGNYIPLSMKFIHHSLISDAVINLLQK